jgi:sulfate adenylyltransferase
VVAQSSDGELPAELRGWPVLPAGPELLADLELALGGSGVSGDGVLRTVPVSPGRAELAAVPELVDAVRSAGHVVLADPEGTPLAVLALDPRRTDPVPDPTGDRSAAPGAPGGAWVAPGTAAPAGTAGAVGTAAPAGVADDWWRGTLHALRPAAHGPFRALQRPPAEVRAALPPGPVLAAVVDRPLLAADLARLTAATAPAGGARPGTTVLLLVRTPAGTLLDMPPEVLVRAVRAAAAILDRPPVLVTVPMRPWADPDRDAAAAAELATAYGATALLDAEPVRAGAEWAAVRALLDAEPDLPAALAPPAVRTELRRWRPPRSRRGLTVFFTGLSGSGKSTLARALVDELVEDGSRRVTVLDGDLVRRVLSAGLGFSRADRDFNVRRIGWVAAEVSRHGGVAVCAPIAPYAATRAAVRREVSAVGDFVLVHVATPLEVCERRDRKGLYAKARAGLIPEFTGISDPYEEPDDADLVLDTSQESVQDGLARVLAVLRGGGWLPH